MKNKNKTVVEVNKISKSYNISQKVSQNAHPTIKDEFVRLARKPLEIIGASGGYEKEKFNALNEISFTVQQGDVVGIMGRNGSGKSTLFKILSRITQPTSGGAVMHGKVASLLEVGTGFNPELTGRENVFLNGSILGMKKKEIEKKFSAIVAFSEVEHFIDTPVKFYSSGMKIRLAFAVAANLDADILIIDEVLAVGDLRFKQKSIEKMKEVAASGKTILFVSHIISQIEELCTRGVVLDNGDLIFDGDIEEAIEIYEGLNEDEEEDETPKNMAKELPDKKSQGISIQNIAAVCKTNNKSLPELKISFDILNSQGYATNKAWVGAIIAGPSNSNILLTDSEITKTYLSLNENKKTTKVTIIIKDLNLYPDTYRVKLGLRDDAADELVLQRIEKATKFKVESYKMPNGYYARKKGPRPPLLFEPIIESE